MEPVLVSAVENDGALQFTIKNINVSLANAVRRTILSKIPTLAFITDTHETNECNIVENSSRLHNEILKQRLACIPIHYKEDLFSNQESPNYMLFGKCILEVNVSNETDNIMYVTTEHFKIKNKETGNYLSEEKTHQIFPKNPITQCYIDFARLRPKISDSISTESIKLTCEFSISNAKYSGMYSVVSKCAYSMTPDPVKQEKAWENYMKANVTDDMTKEDIDFQKRNFDLLDAQRYVVEDSFDFIIQSVGVYENMEIVRYACITLQRDFIHLIESIDADMVSIVRSENNIKNCFDFILEDDDYTMGKVIEYILYEKFYKKEKRLTFCAFRKNHPHDKHSIIRVAFQDAADRQAVRQLFRTACVDAQEVFKKLYQNFKA